ncbi:hypothetical protein WH47_00945 [Habropoda laboriosa]|uniref:Uncharacterized protein n=1 Tax=Habropoda laboriosa TaxID=597456 RepID=A0A0L7R6X3_9HYME|nr:hypothetical protein WH47_00945 [Habropoda laboriosa]
MAPVVILIKQSKNTGEVISKRQVEDQGDHSENRIPHRSSLFRAASGPADYKRHWTYKTHPWLDDPTPLYAQAGLAVARATSCDTKLGEIPRSIEDAALTSVSRVKNLVPDTDSSMSSPLARFRQKGKISNQGPAGGLRFNASLLLTSSLREPRVSGRPNLSNYHRVGTQSGELLQAFSVGGEADNGEEEEKEEEEEAVGSCKRAFPVNAVDHSADP